MYIVSCPNCGAEVRFRSPASVMAVCAYCSSTILKDADEVRNLGKMSAVLEDYSPIQIGTSGSHGGRNFSVVGRIQQRYAAGLWNEWYLLFDDGTTAWLGDSSGMYTLTVARTIEGALPTLAELVPAKNYDIGGITYMAAEVRTGECIAGQGELPFKVGAGWRIQVADLRSEASFLTLDYTDGPQPVAYAGTSVTLELLKCQLLRDDDQIKASAGRYRGRLTTLNCPACGSQIKFLPGLAAHLVCPACQAQVDGASPEAQTLAAGQRLEQAPRTLELGANTTIDGKVHQVLGMLRRADDEGTEWNEYLLHSPKAGFLWLVETEEGWSRASVLYEWPTWGGVDADKVKLKQGEFNKLYDYQARVVFAAGAFNWRVQVGDTCHVYEFKKGKTSLAAEISGEEMTWSRSLPVSQDQMRLWFGAQYTGRAIPAPGAAPRPRFNYMASAKGFSIFILLLNAIPLFMAFSRSWIFSAIAIIALMVPAWFLDIEETPRS